ncbi:prenyltransferase [Limosilactobacillus panis]|uniref:prenyltransferase n=1 Tax=Limosilactobacillus panis TaxID=47493 RepID=UPI001C95D31B|nr:prenyltransferase [Limosilactobacillus panis]QZN93448.1 prenyltransferase [Limosilactobacillus panis]
MSLNVFLELVEIKAKTASVVPFLLGMGFSLYYFHSINWLLALIFFVAMFLFNMAVDMLDNYNDYNHAVDQQNYKQKTNIIGRENLSPHLVLGLLVIFTATAALLGLYLVYLAGWPVLWMGIFCFAIGILYSSGPHPISNLPFGELASGFTMGFMIVLLSVYLNAYQQFQWNWATLWRVFVIALPDELWISNLMLANNICDAQEDEDNHRKTIVHFIGKRNALIAFSVKNVIAFLVIVASPLLKIAPWTVILSLVIVPFTYHQNKLLVHKQIKCETFICGVKILLVGSVAQLLMYWVGILL